MPIRPVDMIASEDASSRFSVLVLSGVSPTDLDSKLEAATDHLEKRDLNEFNEIFSEPSEDGSNVHRAVVLIRPDANIRNLVGRKDARFVFSGVADGGPMPVAFMFPGQGAGEHIEVLTSLYANELAFRKAFDEALQISSGQMGVDLSEFARNSSKTAVLDVVD